jgi:hypothetical protein
MNLIKFKYFLLFYSTGFPAQSYPEGINLPGGTTELGPIMHPKSKNENIFFIF